MLHLAPQFVDPGFLRSGIGSTQGCGTASDSTPTYKYLDSVAGKSDLPRSGSTLNSSQPDWHTDDCVSSMIRESQMQRGKLMHSFKVDINLSR